MTDKLRQLTEQIYQEGVERAKKEAEEILKNAREQKTQILRAALDEAEEIKKLAHREAEAFKVNAESELRLAQKKALALTRQKISELIVARVAKECASEIFSDPKFLKRAVMMVIKAWDPLDKEGKSIYVRLPAEDREVFEQYLFSKAKTRLIRGVKVVFDEHIKSGFAIAAQDDSFRIGFTDEDFEALIKYFLRRRMNEFLFGEA